MAFQTGTSTSIENLLTQLSTFLQANGWTQTFFNTITLDVGSIGFSKNGIFVSFQYTEATDGGAMAIYQATAADASPTTEPWTATGDSGNGVRNNTLSQFDTQRCCNQFGGPHTAFFFFENDASPAYVHIVVEVDAGRYRHFGFGEILKIGDWSGGEYCYGHFWSQPTSQIDNPAVSQHTFGMDASATGQTLAATMRVDGYPGEPDPATVWANIVNNTAITNDTAGNPRWIAVGGWRHSREYAAFSGFEFTLATAYKPLFPIPFELWDPSGTPDLGRRVGFQADVRMCNIANLEPGQIISIAGEDWYFFPWVRKQFLQNNTEESWNGGIAYRRENA
ncbi:MAG: hypothetical protein KAJ55_09630 [Anaerolineales bacterium]|nr:hypothetical protein [Anaerolineales bacterium]